MPLGRGATHSSYTLHASMSTQGSHGWRRRREQAWAIAALSLPLARSIGYRLSASFLAQRLRLLDGGKR
jgi:hypothetical protein